MARKVFRFASRHLPNSFISSDNDDLKELIAKNDISSRLGNANKIWFMATKLSKAPKSSAPVKSRNQRL